MTHLCGTSLWSADAKTELALDDRTLNGNDEACWYCHTPTPASQIKHTITNQTP
jgi:hypothetical protein